MKEYLNREFLLSNKEKILKAAAVIIIVAVAFCVFVLDVGGNKNEELKIEENQAVSVDESAVESEPEMIMVDVSGAVKEPKVVELPADSRVTDAIAAAGGLTDDADTVQINQAAFLNDGEKIYVPKKGEDTSSLAVASGASTYSASASGKVDINTATSEELQTLNGIGPVTAEKILKYRSDVGYFKSIEDIKNVDGIGDKTYENLKEYITV